MKKILSPKAHGALDYGLMATLVAAPPLLGLSRRARTVFGALGVNAGVVSGLTAQPLAVKPLISFQTHKKVETVAIPVYALLPVVTGAVKEKRARVLWLGTIAALVAGYVLTDWDAKG